MPALPNVVPLRGERIHRQSPGREHAHDLATVRPLVRSFRGMARRPV